MRNGGNPVSNADLGRDAHWFDGDGMLSGVSFRRSKSGTIVPDFVNQYILTDVYLATKASKHLTKPILPSIATLVNPLSSFIAITRAIFRTIFLVILSFLPGSKRVINKISVANTNVVYHDGRALATCESGPPMRIALPGLETVGWFDGGSAQGEASHPSSLHNDTLGGSGMLGWIREWTTAHPKVDPKTNEMFLFHSSFAPPYVQYSVIPQASTMDHKDDAVPLPRRLLNQPVSGIKSAKMMHDFGVSRTHCVIMDLPLSLDPLNLAVGRAPVEYDATKPARFGVFPRYRPHDVLWFETTACCIFHVANTWDDRDLTGKTKAIHMLSCRLTSSSLVFSAGNIAAPPLAAKTIDAIAQKPVSFFAKYDSEFEAHAEKQLDDESAQTSFLEAAELESSARLIAKDNALHNLEVEDLWTDMDEDQCRLYHYQFSLDTKQIISQYALAAIPFEFPSMHPALEMSEAQFIYGCSTTSSSFGAALGRSVKIDVLLKINSKALIAHGEILRQGGLMPAVSGCVDKRPLTQVLASTDADDHIQAFRMPPGWYVQEPRFVPRRNAITEDDGFLIAYAFDERQLDDEGDCPDDESEHVRAKSELWVIDAKDMRTVVTKVHLPQRVPYGLHGAWFSEAQVKGQRAIDSVRSLDSIKHDNNESRSIWMHLRNAMEHLLG